MKSFPKAESADIALLLEGTFPYVSGGVSTWVFQIIRAFPQYRFAVVFLGSRPEDYGDIRYPLPPNLVHLETHYLYEHWRQIDEIRPISGDPAAFSSVGALHDIFKSPESAETHALEPFQRLARDILPGGRLTLEQFLHSNESWRFLTERYRRYCADPSFLDYFWSVRIMHQPLWQLAAVAAQLIPVRVCHTVSTGYAGFLGAVMRNVRGVPLLLTEHGIYTKERKIDLFHSEWVRDNRNIFQKDPTELSYFRQIWMDFFGWLGRLCYESADPIIALYEGNRQRQIAEGAPATRTRVIPNGVDLARFRPLRDQRPAEVPPVLCLIGRVVPIKDVKTFLRAMRIVLSRLPQAEGWIAGPTEEDPEYVAECKELAESLGLAGRVRFLGQQRVDELFPKIGLVVLSSISEALPLVILEGFAAGVPSVATDVGSCRQLIEGMDDVDKAIGRAGRVIGMANPQALADASLALLQDRETWDVAQRAAITRVERYYTDTGIIAAYRELYDQLLESSPVVDRRRMGAG